jgi:hypothetical protein
MIEVVVYLGVISGKFLEYCTTFKLLHRSFSSSKWQVRIFASVVGPASTKAVYPQRQFHEKRHRKMVTYPL